MTYKWKTGSRIIADANAAAAQFEQLEKEGRLNAENVVSVNKPEDAVLHGEFEWRNKVAADEWRKHQARHLMNCLCVVAVNEESKEETTVRALFNIVNSDYESIGAIFKSESKTETLINQALRELMTFKQKYKMLEQLAPVFTAINSITNGNEEDEGNG